MRIEQNFSDGSAFSYRLNTLVLPCSPAIEVLQAKNPGIAVLHMLFLTASISFEIDLGLINPEANKPSINS